MRMLKTVLRTAVTMVVFLSLTGLYNKHNPPGGGGDPPNRPKFNPAMMPKRVGPAQQHGVKRAQEGRPGDPGDTSETTPEQPKNHWDDPDFDDARHDMTRFGEMGDGAMDKIWDGDGRGNGDHKPSSTEPGKTLFPPGTTREQVDRWFRDIAANPGSKPVARPNNDGWEVTGRTPEGITCVVTLDKDGSISGGHPVYTDGSDGVTRNPMPPRN
ncbi:EndoU domain-containing protein [Phytomonospora endophytica]|uniref:Bacterial EndoU nuclease domain-containing protein n=1 Tax=Phytomonospora endophytica TaxID=714109 RepID=A0A841FQI1_9ACTN|nr:EndoU domain-containing protein [Phytomonospora endophytica]MBB6036058.1 hypothetical protein [Phytomonospora endophytica]GIG66963.1 hypothetical protein Pen01_32580 [Phytomonospora endophytica]